MKKLIAALAVLAIAAAAQADLLATWNTATQLGNDATVTPNTEAANYAESGFTVSDLSLYGNAKQTSAGSIFGVNNLTDGVSGIKFTVGVDSGWTIDDAKLSASYTGSPTGPKQIDFLVGSSVVATHARPTQGSTFSDISLGSLGSGATVALVANTAAGTVRSGSSENFSNTGGTFVIRTSMTLSGDLVQATSVPEPATMSLLGLGALAMVLRRKLRK